MNKYTKLAYNYFADNSDARKEVIHFLRKNGTTKDIAKRLADHLNELSQMELLAVFTETKVSVVEAVDLEEVAFMLLIDDVPADAVATESIPEYSSDFDSNKQ